MRFKELVIFSMILLLSIFCWTQKVLGQDILAVLKLVKTAKPLESYQYSLTTTQSTSDSTLSKEVLAQFKPETIQYRVNTSGTLVVGTKNMVWYGKEKMIVVDDNSKTITVYQETKEKQKANKKQSNKTTKKEDNEESLTNFPLMDSLLAHVSEIQVQKISNDVYQYSYTILQKVPLEITLFHHVGDSFFYKMVFSSTTSGIKNSLVREISGFSTVVDERFMSETYYFIAQKESYIVSSYFPHYQLLFLDYEN